MRLLTTVVGGAICGALVFGVWPEMWKSYGIMGGWLAATIVIGICWYMNHWIGMIWNEPGKIWVDQGWSVCSSGIVWAIVRFHDEFAQCLPTLVCCLIGGSLAGVLAARVKKRHPAFNRGRTETQEPVCMK